MKDWYNDMTRSIAVERANKLKERLNKSTGGKWKSRVHENLGWHYNVYCGTISVSQYGARNYSCLIGDGEYEFTGSGEWTIDNNASTPEESIRIQLAEAKRVADKIYQVINDNISKCPLIKLTK